MRIYTIGHSNVDAARIIDLLLQNSIDVVVDVRGTPYSRYAPQFNKERFSRQLKDSSIEYVSAGDYLSMRTKDVAKENERPEYIKGIDRLIKIADEKRAAIMCSEENPDNCHRHQLITQTLLARGIAVVHIRGNGNLEEARTDIPPQSTLF